jgi:G3E family GTPase
LYSKREQGKIPPFRRLVVETTGLADPVPILSTITSEPVIRHHFRLGNVITTVDAVNGIRHMDSQPESVKQAAIADRIVLTKVDISDPKQQAAVIARLKRLNPAASIVEADHGATDPSLLLAHDINNESHKMEEVQRWLESSSDGKDDHGHDHKDVNRHDDAINAYTLTFDRPMDWTAFGIWLTMLLQSRGEDILRVKGILNVIDVKTPVIVQGVQHIVHPPTHLKSWPDKDRSSRIVFIVRNIKKEDIENSLSTFNSLAQID